MTMFGPPSFENQSKSQNQEIKSPEEHNKTLPQEEDTITDLNTQRINRREFLRQTRNVIVSAGAASLASYFSACGPLPEKEWADDLTPKAKQEKEKTIDDLINKNEERINANEQFSEQDLQKMWEKIKKELPQFEQHVEKFKEKLFEDLKLLPQLIGIVLHTNKDIFEKYDIMEKLGMDSLHDLDRVIKDGVDNFKNEFFKNFEKYLEQTFLLSGALFNKERLVHILNKIVNNRLDQTFIMEVFQSPEFKEQTLNGVVGLGILSQNNPLQQIPLGLSLHLLNYYLLDGETQSRLSHGTAHLMTQQASRKITPHEFFENPRNTKPNNLCELESPYQALSYVVKVILGHPELTMQQKLAMLKENNTLEQFPSSFDFSKLPGTDPTLAEAHFRKLTKKFLDEVKKSGFKKYLYSFQIKRPFEYPHAHHEQEFITYMQNLYNFFIKTSSSIPFVEYVYLDSE